MEKIPLKIHLIFLSKEEEFPELFSSCLERIRLLHPHWEIRLYNEDDAGAIISSHFPELLDAYNAYAYPVQRSDILRVLLVYLFGGFYMDLDILCLKTLDELTRYDIVLGEEKTISREDMEYLGLQNRLRIANYMFGSVPRHPFWLVFLKAALAMSARAVYCEDDILETTGPGLLTNVYHNNRKSCNNITVLRNTDRACLRQGHAAIACHFGNFGAHLHRGSWRWGKLYRTSSEAEHQAEVAVPTILPFEEEIATWESRSTQHLALLRPRENDRMLSQRLKGVYERLSPLCQTISSTADLGGLAVLVLGDPCLNAGQTTGNNIYVLYTILPDTIPDEWIDAINNHYDYCLVSHSYQREQLVRGGVAIPVKVIGLAFTRLNRFPVVAGEEEAPAFTVGFSGTGDLRILQTVQTACRCIRDSLIPDLRLKLIGNNDLLPEFGESWVQTIPVENVKGEWYSDMHCFLSIQSSDRWTFGPMESLYMGIPTLVTDEPLNEDLVRSGYCQVLREDSTGIEWCIREIFSHYEDYNKIAIDGAQWIEDRWSAEQTEYELLTFISAIFQMNWHEQV